MHVPLISTEAIWCTVINDDYRPTIIMAVNVFRNTDILKINHRFQGLAVSLSTCLENNLPACLNIDQKSQFTRSEVSTDDAQMSNFGSVNACDMVIPIKLSIRFDVLHCCTPMIQPRTMTYIEIGIKREDSEDRLPLPTS